MDEKVRQRKYLQPFSVGTCIQSMCHIVLSESRPLSMHRQLERPIIEDIANLPLRDLLEKVGNVILKSLAYIVFW